MCLLAAGKEFSFSISDKYIHRSVVLVVRAPLWFVPGRWYGKAGRLPCLERFWYFGLLRSLPR